jgi:peroxiredoxin Q/BCP
MTSLPIMMRRGRQSANFGNASSKGHEMINEGEKAPSIKAKASDGSVIDLAEPGQPLVLYFYPKDDTSGCTREAQDFTSLASDYAKSGVKVVGISRDPMKKHERFIDKYGLLVPLVSDEDGAISDAFGTWVEKSMYGRKYMGMERATYLIGTDGRILKAWRKVKVPGHAMEVLEAAKKAT